MAVIEIGPQNDETHERQFIVDGVVIRDCMVWESGPSSPDEETEIKFQGYFRPQALKSLRDVRVGELLTKVQSVIFREVKSNSFSRAGWDRVNQTIELGRPRRRRGKSLRFVLKFEMEFWDRSYSVIELAKKMHEIVKATSSPIDIWPNLESEEEIEPILNGFGIESDIDSMDLIGDVVEVYCEKLLDLLQEAERSILESHGDSIVKLFTFPPAIKSACEQYLLYFGQFLKDLGIDAETHLKEEASRVLFTVTPSNKKDALDSIREALDCYLHMPNSAQAISDMTTNHDLAIMQLQANIFFLKSQITLAGALVQAKDATINAQQAQIAALESRQIDLRRYLPSDTETQNNDYEPLIEGVVGVKKLEIKGVEFDLPGILRTLKRKI